MSKHTDYPHYDNKGYSTWDSDSDTTTFFNKAGQKVEDPNKRSSSFLSRFKSNMADYFDENPNAFDFTNKGGKSVSDKVAEFSSQFESGFSPVAEGFGIYQPPTNPMTVIPGQQGQPGLLSQIAGPVAGAAASAFFCDMRLKHDVNCLTDMNLVKDDLADVAYFVKELQDS